MINHMGASDEQSPAAEHIFLYFTDEETAQLLERAILRPAGFEVTQLRDRTPLETLLQGKIPSLIILEDSLPDGDGLEQAQWILDRYPALPVILYSREFSDSLAVGALRRGLADYLFAPLRRGEVLEAVRRALQRRRRLDEWTRQDAGSDSRVLLDRLRSLEKLQRVGRTVTSMLDLNRVLKAVVDAAVELTGAEEGSLLLLDEISGELYMRAARNFGEDFVRTFRLPIQDTLAGQVIQSGQAILLDEKTPQKIKTAYLVYTLIYVPLVVHQRVIGVLGVDNRQSRAAFTRDHLVLVSTLADYAAVAIENARLYTHSQQERSKLETILTGTADGVIVVDLQGRLVVINQTARKVFGIENGNLIGKRLSDVVRQPDLLGMLSEENQARLFRSEITLEDGRVLSAQSTPIPGIGQAIIMQDITYLKELDRIKSDFVNTVSHDLRSPLTAILGYVELIERVGQVNEQQKEFIRRVQMSVHSITALINDLLDLGKIEAGFDTHKERVPLPAVLQFSIEGLRGRMLEKNQRLEVDLPADLPFIHGNPTRLNQMFANLIGNAVKYTPPGQNIWVRAREEGGQVLVQVQDTGPGILPSEQPLIFDKFFRGSNLSDHSPGTGLGLAIVKSIVENHQGRIWVDSAPGRGTTFTVVLPTVETALKTPPGG